MFQTPEEQAKEIDKKVIKVAIYEAPGTILVGLGLYGKFAANGDAFHPFLDDSTNINMMLAIGVAIMAWGGYTTFTLIREKAKLMKEIKGL